MSKSSNLYRLQQIDSRLDQVRSRLLEIEQILAANTELLEAEQCAQVANQNLDNAREDMRQAEIQVSDQRIKIEQSESTLYGGKVQNPKELQDLQNEVSALKRYLSVLEDRLLEAMIAAEEAEIGSETARQELLQVQARFVEQHAHLKSEQATLEKDIERLNIERHAALSAISAPDLDLYNQLRQARSGVAVAKVIDHACSACGSMMTPATEQAANIPTQINRCDTCGRILYTG